MKKIVMILADGFEEIEALGTMDVLRRLGFELRLAGLTGERARGSHGLTVDCDMPFAACVAEGFAAVVLPGGMPEATNLCGSDAVIDFLRRMSAQNSLVCAICAAPIALARAGLLAGKRFTMYPGFDRYLGGEIPSGAMVETDGNLITGKGPGATFAFAAAIAGKLGMRAETQALYRDMFVTP